MKRVGEKSPVRAIARGRAEREASSLPLTCETSVGSAARCLVPWQTALRVPMPAADVVGEGGCVQGSAPCWEALSCRSLKAELQKPHRCCLARGPHSRRASDHDVRLATVLNLVHETELLRREQTAASGWRWGRPTSQQRSRLMPFKRSQRPEEGVRSAWRVPVGGRRLGHESHAGLTAACGETPSVRSRGRSSGSALRGRTTRDVSGCSRTRPADEYSPVRDGRNDQRPPQRMLCSRQSARRGEALRLKPARWRQPRSRLDDGFPRGGSSLPERERALRSATAQRCVESSQTTECTF